MQAFQSAIDDCELRDMGFKGDRFMWQRGGIRERLDRGLINAGWEALYPSAALQNLLYNHSDRRPILVDTEYYALAYGGGERTKHFEARWLRERDFPELVQEAWHAANLNPNLTTIQEKLNNMRTSYHDWDQIPSASILVR